jgi:hypothetical protein
MKHTLNGDNPQYFFFYHNGLTALCEKLSLDSTNHQLKLDGLGVVNGCQSLTTILSCSERVKALPDARVLVRFYEIPQRDLADRISIYTNSQSAVKPRDLRSNDKRVLALKRAYESAYPNGYMITKRGEERPADRDKLSTVDIATLAKCLMAWHCQRPNIAYNENKLFDKHFEQLFKADYLPSDISGLTFWSRIIEEKWNSGLPLNEALLASPSYSKFHLLYTVQLFFSAASNQIDKVPAPSATMEFPDPDALIGFAANCFNSALDAGMAEYQEKEKQAALISADSYLSGAIGTAVGVKAPPIWDLRIQLQSLEIQLSSLAKEWRTKIDLPPELRDRRPSEPEWLAGVSLPLVYERHFHSPAGRSRNAEGTPAGPTVRFVGATLSELSIAYSPESIVRAFTRLKRQRDKERARRKAA